MWLPTMFLSSARVYGVLKHPVRFFGTNSPSFNLRIKRKRDFCGGLWNGISNCLWNGIWFVAGRAVNVILCEFVWSLTYSFSITLRRYCGSKRVELLAHVQYDKHGWLSHPAWLKASQAVTFVQTCVYVLSFVSNRHLGPRFCFIQNCKKHPTGLFKWCQTRLSTPQATYRLAQTLSKLIWRKWTQFRQHVANCSNM